MGGDLLTLLALRREQPAGGRLFLRGPALTAPGGHGMHSGHGFPVATPADAAAAVLALAAVGANHVKVVTSGARGEVQLDPAVLRAAVAAARMRGLPVAAHAHFQPEQLTAAVDAEVTSIEHGFLLHEVPGLLAQMARDGLFLCPTMRVVESIRAEPGWFGQRLIPQAWPDVQRSVRVAPAAGVALLAGTDSGVYSVTPADVWREVTLLANECGSRWEGLRAATCTAARALGRPDLGSVAPGATADVVFVRRDPVTEAIDAHDVVAVLQAGRVVAGSLPGYAGSASFT
ncbi:MAG: amidohydrolase family protein [Streptomycetales bacterium]